MKRFKATVLGGSGFAGAELVRRLLQHPEVELVRVGAADHIGEPLSSALPHLEGRSSLIFERLTPEQAADGVDVVIMGVPHQASVALVEAVVASNVRVLDLSGAFRLRDPADYERFYGEKHARPDLLEQFVYGLPELNRQSIANARWVASPGCFATSVELPLLPFARAGLLAGPLHTVGITGSSGSGVAPSATTHHPVRSVNLRTYRPLQHQHVPEIERVLRDAGARAPVLSFVPVSAPLSRGIFTTSFFEVPGDVSEASLHETLAAAYRSEPFVRVPRARLPEVVAVSGSNFAEVGLTAGALHDGRRLVTVFSALDNLMKGGAGQAIQNLNLMLGLPETLTLEDVGPYP
jgi:LysW-gamma-L-alpha-aminoadipyl-6-phosphate/LysW-L-glutamyl-5-phosphate reductase